MSYRQPSELQQRSAHKAEDPNLWDTLVGGMVALGERPREALARESWEEAGLCLTELTPLRPGPTLWSRRPLPDGGGQGYLSERLLCAQLTLPEGLRPVNQDGEVQAFALWRPHELREGIAQGLLTLDAARILMRVLAGVGGCKLKAPKRRDPEARTPKPVWTSRRCDPEAVSNGWPAPWAACVK